MTVETLQSLASTGSDYWRWRLMLALTDNTPMVGTLPHSPREGREPGLRGYGWRPGNVVG